MYSSMDRKFPKAGAFVEVVVGESTYAGRVGATNRSGFTLAGHYDHVPPLKGCRESAKYVFCKHTCLTFPKRNAPLGKQRWKQVTVGVEKAGQYVAYVDDKLLSVTVLSLQDVAKRPDAKTVMCLIGGTHQFSASSFEALNEELLSENMVVFPELTQNIYESVNASMTAFFQASALKHAMVALQKRCVPEP